MPEPVNDLVARIRQYARRQSAVDLTAAFLLIAASVLLATITALLLLKSPLYGLIGIVPVFFLRRKNLVDRCRALEPRLGLAGDLVISLQLSHLGQENRENYSLGLAGAFIRETTRKIETRDLRRLVSYRALGRCLNLLLIVIALGLLYPALLPARFWYSLHRQLPYVTTPAAATFEAGSKTTFAIAFGGPYQPGRVTLVLARGASVTRALLAAVGGAAAQEVVLDRNLAYWFEFFGVTTPPCTLAVKAPLYVKALGFTLHYPAYLRLADTTKITRRLAEPAGTEAVIAGKASSELSGAFFEYGDTTRLTCAGDSFSGSFTIDKSLTAALRLVATSTVSEPVTVSALPDQGPLVEIFDPGTDIEMPLAMAVTLGIRTSDDYGLKGAVLNIDHEGSRSVPIALAGTCEDTVYYRWNLVPLGVLPGDRVGYSVSVYDGAGNRAASRQYNIYFPTLVEIYQAVNETETTVQDSLRRLRAEQADDYRELERLTDKLKRERELSWPDRGRLKELTGRETALLEKLDAWKRQLQNTIEALSNSITLDPESIARLEEIKEILEEIAGEELRQALADLAPQIDKNAAELRRALENARNRQAEFAEALKRTLELLRRYQQEEKLHELARRARELAAGTADSGKEQIAELADEILALAASPDLEPEIKDGLSAIGARTKMTSRKREDGSASASDLNKIASDLDRLYEQLVAGRRASLRKKIVETLNQLIEISKTEEKLARREKIEPGLQNQIIGATRALTDSMYGEQRKSIYITPGIGKRLARAVKEMELARAQSGKGLPHREHAVAAMAQLNAAGLELLAGLSKAAEGSSSTGVDQLLKALGEIAQGQGALNQSLLGLLPIPVSGLSREQQSELRRLADAQRGLREALENLAGEAGDRERETVDRLAQEMAEIEEALYQYRLDRTLIERQQNLITRLLDAQKSLRLQDFRQERVSKPGTDELREIIERALSEPFPKEYDPYIREYFRRLLEEQ